MNIDGIATKAVAGLLMVAALTTIFARANSAKVIDALGRAFSSAVSASLGKGVSL